MTTKTRRKSETLAAIREFASSCVAQRWPGHIAEPVKRQPKWTEPPHTWREWRRDRVEGRAVKVDVCRACESIRVQDNQRRRSESSYVPWVRRTLFYMPRPTKRPASE